MNAETMTTPTKKPLAIAVIKFMDNGDLEVSLSSCNGVTARKLDMVATALYKKLGELRAVERRKDMIATRAANAAKDEVNENG